MLLRSWAQVIEAFISGQVNVIHLLSPMTVWARYGSKVPAKVVAWNHVGGSGLTVAPDIADVRQLGGKSVAIPFWYSIHNVVLQQLLRDNGLRAVSRAVGAALAANEVNLVVLPPSDMPPALASKRIAGYIVAEPFNALAENLKVGRVQRFTGDVWRNHACCVVFMHEHDLEQRPEWSQKVVNAIVKAQLWTREHRAEAAQLLSKDGANRYTPHAPEVLGRVLAPAAEEQQAYLASGAIRHADWQERRIDFQPYPYPSYTEELVRRLKDTLIEGNNAFLASLDPRQVASDLVDDRFVRQALAEVGGLQAFGLAEGFVQPGRDGAGVTARESPAAGARQPASVAAPSPPRARRDGAAARAVLGVAGLLTLFALWWLGVALFGAGRRPGAALRARQATFAQPGAAAGPAPTCYEHVLVSLKRVLLGLLLALAVGVPLGSAGGRLAPPGGGDHAGVPVPADDLAAVVDAHRGDADGRGRPADLFPAGLRRALADPAEHRRRRAPARPALAATEPQPRRHALGNPAPGDPAGHARPCADRRAPGHRHPLDRAGALRDAWRQRRDWATTSSTPATAWPTRS